MRDFTLKAYKTLLLALQQSGYRFQTFEEFITIPHEGKTVVMRHDVDELAWNALAIAHVEKALGIKATYFFRIVKQSNVPEVIKEIVEMGHEVGYHYEDLASAKGDEIMAMETFRSNLSYFRTYFPVRSVCMHGSSTSQYDNRLLWKNHSLADFGLIGEPYLSIDFNQIYYLTDTGYAWDGGRFATRDIVESPFQLAFHSTPEIVESINAGTFPEKAMILAHTLWTDSLTQWYWLHTREYLRNRLKLLARDNKIVANIYNRLVAAYWKS